MTLVIILHVLVSIFLVMIVLLQPGGKGGMGSAFGGAGGSTVFGGRGANNFLAQLTAGAAVTFMCTSFGLAFMSSEGGSAFDRVESSELDSAAEIKNDDKEVKTETVPVTEKVEAEVKKVEEKAVAAEPVDKKVEGKVTTE